MNVKKFTVISLLGFASGLPLALVSSTLQTWFTKAGLSIQGIGLLGLISFPYFLKFLWAPLCDAVNSRFGRRRIVILVTQVLLLFCFLIMPLFPAHQAVIIICLLALLAAFASSTQDIAINGYMTEVLTESERGLGAALYVAFYRVAMLVAGGISLIIADYWGWQISYQLMGALMLLGIFATIMMQEESVEILAKRNLQSILWLPFKELLSRDHVWRLLGFIVLYKLTEAFTSTVGASLVNTFLIRDLHFTLTQIGLVNKFVSFAAVLLGMFVGGAILSKVNLKRALLSFGLLQVIGNACFILLTTEPKSIILLGVVVGIENFASGLVTAALIALIMASCNKRFTGTQFALLTALSSVGRTLLAPVTGFIVMRWGWQQFFVLGTVLAVLPLLLLQGNLPSEFVENELQV